MIHDQIIKGNLQDFQTEFNFTDLKEDIAFENYVNYLILSRINSKIFEDNDYIAKINIDNGQNLGIDGIALLVNNIFIFEEEIIDEFKKQSESFPNLYLNFVFTQSKTSPNFDLGELLKFTTAVKDFFRLDNPPLYAKQDIKKIWELKNKLLEYDTLQFVDKNNSPTLNLYFVTTGNPTEDETFIRHKELQENEIKRDNPIFRDVKINLIDRTHLIKYYQEIQNNVSQRVIFKEKVDLGTILKVGKAFLGYISAFEYLKLITDEDENFRQNLFYENVRDFKGADNKVNLEIAGTIKNSAFNDKFVLLNNGVTLVAKNVDTNYQGGEVKITNYQIVNGCQTSNVLYLNRGFIKSDTSLLVPIKLIECQDNEITNAITKATNSQNPVPEEAFIALEEFPKELQKFFDSKPHSAPHKIYYERRSREYEYVKPRINQMQVFHLHKLIRAMMAMFVDAPHLCYRFPGELYKQTKHERFGEKRKMFTKGQSPFPYFTSCYTWFVIENMFNKKELDDNYKSLKFHLMLAIRLKIAGKDINNFCNLKETERYCIKILDFLYDDNKCKPIIKELFEQIVGSVDILEIPLYNITKAPLFTDYIIKNVKHLK